MKDDLTKLFERLEVEGVSIMPEIYALTSPHLFGIIKNIVSDDVSAQTILKSIYTRLWEQRRVLQTRHKGDPLSYLRRLAHRSAIDFKFRADVKSILKSELEAMPDVDSVKAKALGISDQDMRILHLAYLKGVSISDISNYEKIDMRKIKASLEKTLNCLRGDAS